MKREQWWLEDTPTCSYSLTAFEPGGGPVLEVKLTPQEFGELKDHLAELRGLEVEDENDDEPEPESEQKPEPAPVHNAASTKAKEPEPEWLKDIPTPSWASIELWEKDGDSLQTIELSLEEFDDVKRHVIAKRGYYQQHEWDRLLRDGIPGCDDSPDQIATELEIARAAYSEYRSLVVAEEPPPGLEKLLPKEAKA